MTGPLPYIGGKNRVANLIIATFPPHRTFVEPFAGGAQVFFHKEPVHVEVLNDLNGEIVNFFRVAQRHPDELLRVLRYSLVSRQWYALYKAENPDTLTDIQRAGRFFFLQKASYGGLVRSQHYSYGVAHRPNFDPGKLPELIEKTYQRLQRVQIECLPYAEVIRRYDRPTTHFYCDPPYFNRRLYRYNFSEKDFRELADLLASMRGTFTLSINDTPEIRDIFGSFLIREIEFPYTVQQKEPGKRFTELLISNVKPVR